MGIVKDTGRKYLEYFNTPEEFDKWYDETPHHKRAMNQVQSESSFAFYHTNSFAESREYFKSAKQWNEIHERLLASKIDVDSVYAKGVEQSQYYDVSGSIVDVGRFLEGEPECMIEFTETEVERRGKIIDLYYSPTVSAGIKKEKLIEYGIAIYSIVDALEREGYRVNLYMVAAMDYCEHKILGALTIRVKSSDQNIEMNQMLYCIAHPSMLRRQSFSWMDKKHFSQNGYGRPTALSNFNYNELMWFYDNNPQNSYFLRQLQSMNPADGYDEVTMRDYLYNSIKKQMADIKEGITEHLADGNIHFEFH